MVAFLAAGESSYVTGQIWTVNGGLDMSRGKTMEDVFVLSGVRTPIGKFGGGLASVPPV